LQIQFGDFWRKALIVFEIRFASGASRKMKPTLGTSWRALYATAPHQHPTTSSNSFMEMGSEAGFFKRHKMSQPHSRAHREDDFIEEPKSALRQHWS
jgi:hypothetical protein